MFMLHLFLSLLACPTVMFGAASSSSSSSSAGATTAVAASSTDQAQFEQLRQQLGSAIVQQRAKPNGTDELIIIKMSSWEGGIHAHFSSALAPPAILRTIEQQLEKLPTPLRLPSRHLSRLDEVKFMLESVYMQTLIPPRESNSDAYYHAISSLSSLQLHNGRNHKVMPSISKDTKHLYPWSIYEYDKLNRTIRETTTTTLIWSNQLAQPYWQRICSFARKPDMTTEERIHDALHCTVPKGTTYSCLTIDTQKAATILTSLLTLLKKTNPGSPFYLVALPKTKTD